MRNSAGMDPCASKSELSKTIGTVFAQRQDSKKKFQKS